MKVEQKHWTKNGGWRQGDRDVLNGKADLVFAFGGRDALADHDTFATVRALYPGAHLLAASTAGEIHGRRVCDDSIGVTAVRFDAARVATSVARLDDPGQSYAAGRSLAERLDRTGLRHVFVISEGLHVNGSELARGLRDAVPAGVAVTGGLAGDGARMEGTLVGLDAPPAEKVIAAIGFYGPGLHVGYGSLGGWDSFGPERLVTRSTGNVLHELDGEPALALYKRYLGDEAAGLPSTGLLFPLTLRAPGGESGLVRTILGVDEATQSLTFAGDVPEGYHARLMKANFDRLVDGAIGAARGSQASLASQRPQLALLVSCVGRKLILKQRVEEEVEGVADVLGDTAALAGFYSYGEICPHLESVHCELHNQTMTITTLAEAA